MKNNIEFFFDCSSPWTYLAFKEIVPLCERNHCDIVWKPILVGGIFNSTNPSVYEHRANPVKEKLSYSKKDMSDWAKIRGIQFNWPDKFPVNSVKAMRGAFYAIDKGFLPEYAETIFASYWTGNKDISNSDVLTEIISSLEWNEKEFSSYIELADTKELLKKNTQELIDRGGFGSPTIFLNKTDMYFGNDRLHLLEKILDNRKLV
ncbi:MAG: 2-hydroxychromene-2-carboxylate isomerase [Oceanicoccus sp.]